MLDLSVPSLPPLSNGHGNVSYSVGCFNHLVSTHEKVAGTVDRLSECGTLASECLPHQALQAGVPTPGQQRSGRFIFRTSVSSSIQWGEIIMLTSLGSHKDKKKESRGCLGIVSGPQLPLYKYLLKNKRQIWFNG